MAKVLLQTSFVPGEGEVPFSIVLRDFGEGHYSRYVTHMRLDKCGGHCHGHYFNDLKKATSDFYKRASEFSLSHDVRETQVDTISR